MTEDERPDPGYPFDPDWCLAPVATLEDWLGEHPRSHLARSRGDLATAGGQLIAALEALEPLTSEHAERLASWTGASAQFWMNLERNYRDGLAAGKTDVTRK